MKKKILLVISFIVCSSSFSYAFNQENNIYSGQKISEKMHDPKMLYEFACILRNRARAEGLYTPEDEVMCEQMIASFKRLADLEIRVPESDIWDILYDIFWKKKEEREREDRERKEREEDREIQREILRIEKERLELEKERKAKEQSLQEKNNGSTSSKYWNKS